MQMLSGISGAMKLILLLLFLIVLWLITTINPGLEILWFIMVLLLSVVFIVKYKSVTKGDVVTGIVLGAISMPSNFFMGLFTIAAYVGGVSVFKACKNRIPLVKSKRRKEILKTVLLAVLLGIILGTVNVFLGRMNMTIDPSFRMKWVLDAIRAGIAEEVIFRFFFFAICIHLVEDKVLSKTEGLICYLIIIIPHVLIHFDRTNFSLQSFIVLFLLFGVPLAILQRKHDLTSAMGAHGVIDLIRFIVFGV